jgi:hypothetical protein
MDNLGTLCILGFVLLVALFILPRLMGGFGSPYGRRGPLSPRYDDPDIDSRGNFGGTGYGDQRPTYDDPNIRSRGSFGRGTGNRSFFPRRGSPSSSGRVDNPNVRSRGGFGRSK